MSVARLHELEELGYSVFSNVFRADELHRIRGVLDEQFDALDRQSDGWGVAISPLLSVVPRMRRYFDLGMVVALLEEVFQHEVSLVHTAARWTNSGEEPLLDWHMHEYGQGEGRWEPRRKTTKFRFTRFIASVYVDGSDPEIGQIVVFPRRLGESTAPPFGDPTVAWPGETPLVLHPGSILVHDVALYHCARRGNITARRRIFGGVFQRSCDPRFPDDQPPSAI